MINDRPAEYTALLDEAIAEAKAAGLVGAAAELESSVFAAFTTSSEMLGEHRIAILEFLRTGGQSVPTSVAEKLNGCLEKIRKIWPDF